MPFRDGTGPRGQGPGTGRGRGPCGLRRPAGIGRGAGLFNQAGGWFSLNRGPAKGGSGGTMGAGGRGQGDRRGR